MIVKKEKTVQISATIPEKLSKQISEIANKNRHSFSHMVEIILEEYANKHQKKSK